jgi:hypothetical protein
MPRTIETEPLQKHTLFLYEGDFARLASFFPELGASVAVRRIVRASLKKLERGISPLTMKEKVDE